MDINEALLRQAQRENAESEIDRLRKERDYWREECRKRAEFLREVESDESRQCPDCWIYNDEHNADCDVPLLSRMPEEPKQ